MCSIDYIFWNIYFLKIWAKQKNRKFGSTQPLSHSFLQRNKDNQQEINDFSTVVLERWDRKLVNLSRPDTHNKSTGLHWWRQRKASFGELFSWFNTEQAVVWLKPSFVLIHYASLI